jgi:hypothetical protein
MKTIYVTEVKKCDICVASNATYDAPTYTGQWANMCDTCFPSAKGSSADIVGFILSVDDEPEIDDNEVADLIREALLEGDLDLVEELVGDRDIHEFI